MLRFDGLEKRFGSVTALHDVSFTVRPGAITGFVGRNGAGKSTTMRSVFGLVSLDAGTVTWHGAPIGPEQLARFGFMPEQRGLYRKMKVGEQVAYFAQLKGVEQADAKAAATRWLTALGLADRIDDKLEALSHGNQQRVQLAVALAHDPDLSILDEPFNGLDPSAVTVLNQQLRAEAEKGKAVLFSSHQLDLVEELCDELVVIDQGQIKAQGTVTDVRRQAGPNEVTVAYSASPDWLQLGPYNPTILGTRSAKVSITNPDQLAHLLPAATAAGPLLRFDYDLPSLAAAFQKVTQ